jgi:hypothetical protein
MTDDQHPGFRGPQIDRLRERLPLLRRLEERGFVQFASDGVYVLDDIPSEDFTRELFDEFAVADEWSTGS